MENQKQPFENIEWEAPEYEFVEKNADWFWVVGIVTITLVVLSYLFSNFLLAVFSILAGFTVVMYGARRPRIVEFSITRRGIQIGDKIYLYDSLKSFWVDDNQYRQILILESEKVIMPHIVVPLFNVEPDKVRETLSIFLKEKKLNEPISESISRILKF